MAVGWTFLTARSRPIVGCSVRVAGADPLDPGHRAELNASVLSGLQAEGSGIREIEVLDFKDQCPVTYDFPVATEGLDEIFARALGKIKGLGLEGAIHLADCEGQVAPEGLFRSLAQVLYLGSELEANGRQLFRNLEFMNEVLSLLEFRKVDFHHARGTVVVRGMDHEFGLLQQVGGHGGAIEAKKGAKDNLGRRSLD
jgi:hypothetical protein